ncbi:MAG: hypothetical protein MJ136_07035 [Clostridia bacterium]|nr:hypothetical protein [Clostridia bacterium]
MKKLIYILMAVLLLIPQCAAVMAADDAFSFHNGLHWGMSSEEVLQAEGQSAFISVTPMNDHVCVGKLEGTFDPFAPVIVNYLFADDRLEMVCFYYYGKAQTMGEDLAYLREVLSRLNGPADDAAPISRQLAAVLKAENQRLENWQEPNWTWDAGHGTVLHLYDKGFYCDLYYINTEFDMDACFPTPTAAPLQLNGL